MNEPDAWALMRRRAKRALVKQDRQFQAALKAAIEAGREWAPPDTVDQSPGTRSPRRIAPGAPTWVPAASCLD